MTQRQDMQDKLKQIRKEEYEKELIEKQNKIKEEREIAQQLATEKLQKGRISRTNEKGDPVSHWDEVEAGAKAALNPEQTAYQDWRAAMTGLLAMYGHLFDAMVQTRKETLDATIQSAAETAFYWAYDNIKASLTTQPELALPVLEHLVEYNEANQLVIHPLERDDGVSLNGELDEMLKEGVVEWLRQVGCTPTDATQNQFQDENGHLLDKAEFERLKEDPNTGLNAFLSDHFDLSFKSRPSMR